MLSCKQIIEGASDYIDNNLKPMAKLEYTMHRMMCRHCNRFLRYFSRLYRGSTFLKQADIPEEKVDEILCCIKRKSNR